MEASELRKLEVSRVTQDFTQANVFIPGGRGPQQPSRAAQPSQGLLPPYAPHVPVTTLPLSQAREVKVEIVGGHSASSLLEGELKAWRGGMEAQLFQHEQTLSIAMATHSGMEQQLASLRQAEVSTHSHLKNMILQQNESIAALQGDMQRAKEQHGASEARQERSASADRVSLDIELKDLRVALDQQANIAEVQLVSWDSEMKQLRTLILQQQDTRSSGTGVEQNQLFNQLFDSARAQAEEVAALDAKFNRVRDQLDLDRTHVKFLEEHLIEDRRKLENSAMQITEIARENADSGDLQDMQDQLRQQVQIIEELQRNLQAVQHEQRDTSQALASTTQATSRGTSLTMDTVSGVQAEVQSLRSDWTSKQNAVSQELSDLRVQLSANPTSQSEAPETRDVRKALEMRVAQQEQSMQALRTLVGSIDQKTQELLLPPARQGDGQVLTEVDALKQELSLSQKLQSSELEREADALHSHVHKVVTAEREARTQEVTRFQSMVNGLRSEVAELAEDVRTSMRSSSSMNSKLPGMDLSPAPSPKPVLVNPVSYECVNPKLEATQQSGTIF